MKSPGITKAGGRYALGGRSFDNAERCAFRMLRSRFAARPAARRSADRRKLLADRVIRTSLVCFHEIDAVKDTESRTAKKW